MKHIPYENGGGTGEKKDSFWNIRGRHWFDVANDILKERPEDPIEEVVDITEAMWISGDKGENNE